MLSATADYALRALLVLAREYGRRPLRADEIADAIAAPRNYLAKTLNALAKAGVVSSIRGPLGGFTLAQPPETLAVAQVVATFDEPRREPRCLLGTGPCNAAAPCAAHQRWSAVVDAVRAPLAQTTLADLLGRPRRRPPTTPGARGRRSPAAAMPPAGLLPNDNGRNSQPRLSDLGFALPTAHSAMPTSSPVIDPTLSVNEIIRRHPASVRALNAFGIDSCCGGGKSLERAAVDAGVSLADITSAIAESIATAAAARGSGEDSGGGRRPPVGSPPTGVPDRLIPRGRGSADLDAARAAAPAEPAGTGAAAVTGVQQLPISLSSPTSP